MTVSDLSMAASPGGIRIDARFDVPQERLWEAIVDADQLSGWIGGHAFIEPRVGGAVVFDIAADAIVAGGVVRSFKPPQHGMSVAMVEHTFVEADRPELTSVCIWAVVANQSGGCDLHFSHDGLGEADREKLEHAWSRRLGTAVPLGDPARRHTSVDDAGALLAAAKTVLIVDFIGPEVPITLCDRGFDVVAKVGPGAADWASCAVREGELVTERIPPPTHADLLHLDWTLGFDEFVEVAAALGAKTFWYHSARTLPPAPADSRGCWLPSAQSEHNRRVVEDAGMAYVDDNYIADVARALPRR